MRPFKFFKRTWNERGALSVAFTMSVVIILFVVSAVLLTSVGTDLKGSSNKMISSQAFYVAEAGIEWSLKRLTEHANWRAGATDIPIGNGKCKITLDDSTTIYALGDTTLVTSVGSIDNLQKTLQVKIIVKLVWLFSMAAGDKLDYSDDGSGVINGDVHANNGVKLGPKYTLNGDASSAPPTIDLPTIDWDFFKAEAIAQGQYVVGDYDFTAGGSPYTGVWYITNTAKVPDNSVIFNGTVVVENDFKIEMNNCIMTATPKNYPVLVVGNTITLKKNNAEFYGFVYAGNDFDTEKNNFVSQGAIVAGSSIKGGKNNKSISLDTSYLVDLNGVDLVLGDDSRAAIQFFSWREN